MKVKEILEAKLGLINKADGQLIEATFSGITLSSSDTSILTADTDADADGETDIVGVAPGTATLHIEAVARYIDPNTSQEVVAGKSADVELVVTPADPEAADTALVVSFADASANNTTSGEVTDPGTTNETAPETNL